MNEKICIDGLDSGQRKVLELLVQEGQEHLIEAWPPAGEEEAEKRERLTEVQQVEQDEPGRYIIGQDGSVSRLDDAS